VLRFSPSKWQYYIEAKDGTLSEIRGVTSSLKIIGGAKTDMLINWSVKKDFEKFLSLIAECRRGDGFVESPWEEVEELVATARREHKNQLEIAGDIGHDAHSYLELIAKTLMAGNDSRLNEVLAKWPENEKSCNAAVAAVAFLADHNVRFLDSERRVLSREWLVCGTMDGDALIDQCERGACGECSCGRYPAFRDKRVVVDYKSSNGVYSSMFGQMALYRKAREEEAKAIGEPIDYAGSVLLRVGKDEKSEFESFFTFGDEEYQQHLSLFKRALDLQESVTQVDGWMRGIRDSVREKEKVARILERAAEMKACCPKSKTYKGVKKSVCLEDGTQCDACAKIFIDRQSKK
jgi:hypothetical protein